MPTYGLNFSQYKILLTFLKRGGSTRIQAWISQLLEDVGANSDELRLISSTLDALSAPQTELLEIDPAIPNGPIGLLTDYFRDLEPEDGIRWDLPRFFARLFSDLDLTVNQVSQICHRIKNSRVAIDPKYGFRSRAWNYHKKSVARAGAFFALYDEGIAIGSSIPWLPSMIQQLQSSQIGPGALVNMTVFRDTGVVQIVEGAAGLEAQGAVGGIDPMAPAAPIEADPWSETSNSSTEKEYEIGSFEDIDTTEDEEEEIQPMYHSQFEAYLANRYNY